MAFSLGVLSSILQGLLSGVSGREMVHLVLKFRVGCVGWLLESSVVGSFTARARERKQDNLFTSFRLQLFKVQDPPSPKCIRGHLPLRLEYYHCCFRILNLGIVG